MIVMPATGWLPRRVEQSRLDQFADGCQVLVGEIGVENARRDDTPRVIDRQLKRDVALIDGKRQAVGRRWRGSEYRRDVVLLQFVWSNCCQLAAAPDDFCWHVRVILLRGFPARRLGPNAVHGDCCGRGGGDDDLQCHRNLVKAGGGACSV